MLFRSEKKLHYPEDEQKVSEVVDMTARRQEMMKQERRGVQRTLLTDIVTAFVVVPSRGLLQVSLYDISENGIGFDLQPSLGSFQLGEEIVMRIYLNQETYFPLQIRVTNCRQIVEEAVNRHGANFIKGSTNDVALHHFVQFIEHVSRSLKKDTGDLVVSNSGI